jgi:hypothetical protein
MHESSEVTAENVASADDAGKVTPPRASRRIKPHAPGKGPKPIRWNPADGEKLRQQVAAISENAGAREDARTMAASGDPGGVADLGAADYSAAATAMAREAAGDQDDTADDEPEITEAPDTAYIDAFAPPSVDRGQVDHLGPADTENAEPEITGRDHRYREQLRETEADRDRLSGLVETMQRAEIERLASGRLADPADLWRVASLKDMRNADGGLDLAKAGSAIDGLLEEHAHWAASRPRYAGALHSGATERPVEPRGKRWSDAFAPNTE